MLCRPCQYGIAVLTVFASGVADVSRAGEKANNVDQAYRVSHWTAEDGFPHNRVNALAQTPDGYLWIGTWRGLARFDGMRFTVFNEVNRPEMVNHTINALTVDREGKLWIGTAEGLLVFAQGRFKRFTMSDGLPSRMVWRLVPSRKGGVWMHCGGDVVRWPLDRPEFVVRVHRAAGEDVRSLRENDDGSLTVVTSHVIHRLTPGGELQPVPIHPGFPETGLGGAVQQKDSLWISAYHALWRWTNGSWKQVLSGDCRADFGTFMQVDRGGSLWVNRREAGFWRCQGDEVVAVRLGEHGAEKTVACMLEDAEGHFWFGTSHGLFQLRPKLIRTYTTEDGLPDNGCDSVCEAPDGAIWVESSGGVACIQWDSVLRFPDEPDRTRWRNILVDREGAVWLGNRHDGLIRWKRGAETNWLLAVRRNVTVGALYSDRDGRVWVGTDLGATWFEASRRGADLGQLELPTNSVRCIYQTRDGAMWFGTWTKGVVRWKEGDSRASTRYTTADGLADNRVFVFHEDDEGVLWIGTRNGLSRLQDGRFYTFRIEQGLIENSINWLEEDEFGRFWFSCNRGIFRIERRELNAVAEGRKARANVAAYGTADGMISPATSGEFQPAGCKSRDGRLWFPTPQGLVVLDPRAVQNNQVLPAAVIEQVMADGEVIWGDGATNATPTIGQEELKLAAGRARLLKVRYTANAFGDPQRVRFQYALAGRDSEWREVTDERVAYYTDLKPGRYHFKVKAANSHGLWNETPATFAFSLAPHFWQTWPFYVSCAVGVALAGLGLHHRRVTVLRRIELLEREQALQAERARIARDLHDDLGANLTGIALKADLAQRQLDASPSAASQLAIIAASTRALVDDMRETVWALNPKHDTLESLARFLAQQAEDYVSSAGLRCRLDLPDSLPPIVVPSPARHQIHLLVKEALHNAVKHAGANEVQFSLKMDGDHLCLSICDDGRGFDLSNPQHSSLNSQDSGYRGNGLSNMRQRVEKMGGQWELKTAACKGTWVMIRMATQSFRAKSS